MNQFIPVEITDDKLSRGYAENKPMGLYRLTGDDIIPTPEQMSQLKIDFVEANIRKQIETILRETCERYNEVDMECEGDIILQYADDIMKIVKKGYGI